MEKVRILFVDDDPNILSGLRRATHAMRATWETVFCDSGADALAAMEKKPFDVVVSDMRMPVMDGAQLLNIVRREYPGTIRVILSGYADSESVLRTVGPAHIYLAKPCDPVVLMAAIARPVALRRLMESDGLRQALADISTLPTPPELFLEIEEELRSPKSSASSVAAIIGRDMAMTAEVLKLTNSAYFSLPTKVTTPLQAVMTLGVEIVQTLVLKVGIFRQFDRGGTQGAQVAALNDYSLKVGAAAERIAVSMGIDAAQVKAAYCAGMLSSIGALVLLDQKGADYRRVLERVTPDRSRHRVETEAFGASHTLIGAYLLGLWGFSDEVVEAVAYADRPSDCPARGAIMLTAVHAARALLDHFPLLNEGAADPLDSRYLSEAKLDDQVEVWRGLVQPEGE